MRVRPALIVLLVVASACGGETTADPGRGDYFTQLARVSETAHIQERGVQRDLRVRLDAASGEDRLSALTIFVDQSARLYQDVVDALRALDPASEVRGPHEAYIAAWQRELDLVVAVRDAGFGGVSRYLEALEAPAFGDADAGTRARCDELQAAVAAADSDVDLVCDGHPA